MYSAFVYVPLIIILGIATYTDLKERLIYNWLNFPGMLYFLVYHVLFNTSHLLVYILGFLVLGGVSFLIDLFTNSIGGGDIKLFALIGMAVG
ncbi:prepilin peptidase, partial [Cerasibacillus sp.]|uniref:prepilin peptidase n=1 Tax=Cerasibacillus sp. TaxID=2498711 RepID=UPI0039C857CF